MEKGSFQFFIHKNKRMTGYLKGCAHEREGGEERGRGRGGGGERERERGGVSKLLQVANYNRYIYFRAGVK